MSTNRIERRGLELGPLLLVTALTGCAQSLHSRSSTFVGAIRGHASAPSLTAEDAPLILFAKPLGSVPAQLHAPVARVGWNDDAAQLVVATVGQRVVFVNDDDICHRFFSSSTPNAFDLGLVEPGSTGFVRFEHAGPVRVYCSLHEKERGTVFVAPTRHVAMVDERGEFRIDELPPGRYELETWNDRLPIHRLRVTVEPGRVHAVDIAVEGPPAEPR